MRSTGLVNNSVNEAVSPVPATTVSRTMPGGGGSSTSTHCSGTVAGSVARYEPARSVTVSRSKSPENTNTQSAALP